MDMKKLLTLVFLVVACSLQALQAQKSPLLPSKPANKAAFPLGSKFVIKLVPVDSVNFNYSVLSIEPFKKEVVWDSDELFEEGGADSTVVFYFGVGTIGDKKATFLLMKNYSKIPLLYTSEIKRQKDGQFEPTSNIGTLPKIRVWEMWPYPISYIGLSEFRKDDRYDHNRTN